MAVTIRFSNLSENQLFGDIVASGAEESCLWPLTDHTDCTDRTGGKCYVVTPGPGLNQGNRCWSEISSVILDSRSLKNLSLTDFIF